MTQPVNTFRSRSAQPLILLAIALISAAGILRLQSQQLAALKRASGFEQTASEQAVEARRQQLSALKQLPSFGFSNLIADWVMLQFIQYFGEVEARRQTGYGLSPDYFDVILARDPYFKDGYLFLSASSTLFAGQPQRTLEIFERELPRLTPTTPERAYVIWRYKATDELLFLGDSEAAAQSFATAAEWASVYDDPESQAIAARSLRTAQALQENPDSTEAQLSAWAMVLSNAFDEATQQWAIQQIERLGGRVEADGGRFRIVSPPAE